MTPAKRRANLTYRLKLVADGFCVRCGLCTAKAAEAAWRRRQAKAPEAHGPEPTRHAWNFDTDELILGQVSFAKAQARRIAASTGASMDVDDMIGDALYGLVVAGRTYDESYNVPFGAWVTKQIRGAVYGGIRRWKKTGTNKPHFVSMEDAPTWKI
jgi:hypothetical protein